MNHRQLAPAVAALLAAFFIIFSANLLPAGEITINEAVKQFVDGNKRLRIAVFDFANTDGAKTRFDVFIADTIVTELSKYPVTLLERKRLEVLLGEQALSQTGVVDSNKALKLGTLLPVDAVVSGSYTEIGNHVVINGRFIHVGTGEILYAFTSSMEGIAGNALTKPVVVEDKRAVCDRNRETVRKVMYNLQDHEAITHAVDTVIAIPFDSDCELHYDVMNIFIRHKIYDDRYRAFLFKTLRQLETPSDDNRANEIIRFFASDGTVDKEEWEAGITALKKMRASTLYLTLRPLLNAVKEKPDVVTVRVDEVMRMTAAREIGRPVPVEDLTMFYAVMNALEIRSGRAGLGPAIATFRKYMKLVPDDDGNNKKAVEILRAMYSTETEQGVTRGSLPLLIAFFKSRTPSESLGESTAELVSSIESKTAERRTEDKKNRAVYQKDLDSVSTGLSSLYCFSIGTAKKKGYRYQVDDRSLFVLRSGMQCEYVPTIKDLEAEMRSGEWERKLKAAETFSKIGVAAKPAEKTVIKYLAQQGFGSQGGQLRRLCAVTLGNIATTDPEGLRLLIASFPDFNDGVSYDAEEAIRKIGAPAIPQLIRGLASAEQATRFRCAHALGELGSKANAALPELQRVADTDPDPYVKKEAAGAVQMVKNDF